MKYFLSISFLIVGIVIFLSGQYMHEFAHSEIFRHYKVDSRIDMFNISIPFEPTTYATNASKCFYRDSCMLAQDLNEVVGYNTQYIFIIIFAGFAFILFLLESKEGLYG